MPGRGPAPKPAEQRRRRNADPIGTTVLDPDAPADGPALAEVTGRADWSAETLRWWEVWRTSPQAVAFLATDWSVLGRLALLVERQWTRPSGAIASEIRLVEASLGATVVDRQRARMAVKPSDESPGLAAVASIDSGRKKRKREVI